MTTINIAAAVGFLRNNMYNATDKLARESSRIDAVNYYVNSANGLYYTVMHDKDPANASEQIAQAVAKKSQFGKGSTIIYTQYGDIVHSLWRSQMKTVYAFKNIVEENWGSLVNGAMLNNNSTGSIRSITENKLNVLCYYVIHEMLAYYSSGTISRLNNAKNVWTTILGKFNNSAGGYVDEIATHRDAYKHGLIKLCSNNFMELRAIGQYQEPSGMWDGTLQDVVSGGIAGHFIRNSSGVIVNTSTGGGGNTEATALMVLGYGGYIIGAGFPSDTPEPPVTPPPPPPVTPPVTTVSPTSSNILGGGFTQGDFYDYKLYKERVVTAAEVGYHYTNKWSISNIAFGHVEIVDHSATHLGGGGPRAIEKSYTNISFTPTSFTIEDTPSFDPISFDPISFTE